MRLLLDTHAFLWFVTGSDKLSAGWREIIPDPDNVIFLSVVSVWEAVIKHAAGKLPMDEPPEDYLPRDRDRHGILSLTFDEDTIRFLARLPSIHKDPFDRILIAQALQHDLTLLSVDAEVRAYPVKFLDS